MFRTRISVKNGEEENPFLLSFSDLMASLLALFILVLVVTLFELEKRREELRVSKDELISNLEGIQELQENIVSSIGNVSQRENSLSAILNNIQNDLRQNGIKVVIAENGTVLRIPEQQLQFALGKFDVPAAGPANAIGSAILRALEVPRNRSLLDTVFIEGHTDSVPNSKEMGNWGLSTYRAISLWKFWTEIPGQLSDLKRLNTIPIDSAQSPKPLISVSGYADTRSTHGLIDGLGLKDDRPEDRRIDIRFTLVSSEKQDLEGLQKNVVSLRERTNAIIHNLKGINNAN
jgi:flagellar motor protein MotB